MPVPTQVVDAPLRASPAYARNTGANAATGGKLLFIDADDEVDCGYVEAMSRALDEHEFVTPRVDSSSLNAEWVRGAHGPAWQENGIWMAFDFLPASGSNAGIRKVDFDRVGGYPEGFVYSDDVAFSWNAHRAGLRLHFVRTAVYRYRYRESLKDLWRQGVTWGDGMTALFRSYEEAGMPGRSVRLAVQEWQAVLSGLAVARGREARAPLVVRLGFCAGRIKGSLRHRVLYL
jgi:GT2 family glycosyltransferase